MKNKDQEPKVHKDLKGFNITVNSFGEIQSTIDIDKINAFLNESVDDKKLSEREGKFADKKSKK